MDLIIDPVLEEKRGCCVRSDRDHGNWTQELCLYG